jgi:hypothetical protein
MDDELIVAAGVYARFFAYGKRSREIYGGEGV